MNYFSPSHPHNSSNQFSSNTTYSPSTSRQAYAPVYVVDVRQLYMRLMLTTSDRLSEIVSAFGLGNADEWCAGNEATYVF